MDNKTLGRFIAGRRTALGLTQRQLAERLCVTDRAVSRWERGIGAPEISLLEPLASALGVTVDALLKGAEEPKAEHTEHREPTPVGIPYFYYRLYRITACAGLIAAFLFYYGGHPPYNLYPAWVEITGALTGLVLFIAATFVIYPLLYRCPRCGKILDDIRPKRELVQHCRRCGMPVYNDMTVKTLKEYLAYRGK